eukprot:6395629-Prymnesium_polylepis.1
MPERAHKSRKGSKASKASKGRKGTGKNVSFTRRMEDSATPDPACIRVSGSADTLKGFPHSRKGASSEGDPRPFAAAGACA